MLGIPFLKLIKHPASAMQMTNQWSASQWGTEPVKYEGSAHEAAVHRAEQQPEYKAEKAWRKSKKELYPSQSVQRMLQLAEEHATSTGLPKIDPDVAFKEYRQHISALQ